ncbi:hypothetical protein AOL_s00109g78 [Orbilia oligospora ATCC 24927]|uniref:Uncharacterized protein n=1 Tax=Arthrobotrys oligospora (strain ATCC 24927 / CBS 115.81 / DSM 1491) TaxID=756982 RepID=G1XK49_ARTOA|nr:hypothetical protein AOL_s00109g78 [Orbilia oligospora ATCC 24927]EGX46506.1 hypothetical protein AOL_s00109g78 [Orbilia oligospora ATCC 24927]
MPAAPIAKGPYHPHYYNQPLHPLNKANTTIAKSGVIIMCAVLVAAGYTVYENREQVKELVDRTRRKISLAMHTFAEEIMPSEGPRQRHQPMAFSGRSLESSGHIHRPNSRTRSRRNSTDSNTLHGDDEKAEGSSRDAYLADSAVRYRPPYPYRGSAEDPESSSLNAKPSTTSPSPSPFDDENQVLFDATTEAALDQHINEKTLSSSPGSDTSSDTLPPAMSEKGIEMSHDAPPMIPAILPTTVIDQPPPLPPRPSHPQFQEALPVVAAVPAAIVALPPPPPPPQEVEEEESVSDAEESHTTFSTSQPYWAIQQWTVDVTNNPNVDEDENVQSRTPSRALSEDEDDDDEEEEDERLTLQSLHSQSETVSVIGSDEGESEDDRVEFVSDLASSVGDTDGWSDLGSQYSEGEGRM